MDRATSDWPSETIPPYYGNLISCHSQAFLSAYPAAFSAVETWEFEALTTIPFGLASRPADPNRLITCHLDPDVGLDRALDTLGVGVDVQWLQPGESPSQAL